METLGKRAALAALSGQPGERVPFLLLTWGFDYIWKCAGIVPWKLALGSFDTWLEAYAVTYRRHTPDIIVYDSVGSGTQAPELIDETFDSWIVRDGRGEEWKVIKSSLSLIHRPAPGRDYGTSPRWDTRDDIDRSVAGGGFDSNRLNGLSALTKRMGDSALVLPTCVTGYISACYALGFGRAMQMMIDDESLFFYLADRLSTDDELKMMQYAQAGAEAVLIADSWASCDILSPAMVRKFAVPYQKRIVDAAKAAGLRAILWNLGDVGPILADEADLNIDAFAFEQPRKGFEVSVARVREAFGMQRCLLGNLDSELLLLRNDPREIREAVLRQMEQSGEGAPFIFSFGSPIPSDAPESAVDVVVESVREFCWGSIG